MRKLYLVFISFFIFVFIIGYPVLARYYNSNQNPNNPGRRIVTQRPSESIRKPASNTIPGPASQPVTPEIPDAPKSPVPMLINKSQGLPPTYTPPDLTAPDVPFSFQEDLPKKKMTAEAADALENLFVQAKKDQIELVGVSAYRSYDYQQTVYERKVATAGKEAADRVSASPGHSEHQSGLAIDVSSPEMNYRLDEKFGDTQAGQWLASNAPKFGFIIRYPEGKEEVTGYQYEPWHLRYVGKEPAREIANRELTLEEYLGSRTFSK